jgi:DNA-directed RNA polymerase I subunit RPA1
LPFLVINPLFFDEAYLLLRSTCAYCFNFRFDRKQQALYTAAFKLLDAGLVSEAKEILYFQVEDSDEAMEEEENATKSKKTKLQKEYQTRAFISALKERVDEIFRTSPPSSYHKTTLTYNERRLLIRSVLKASLSKSSCHRCNGSAPKFRSHQYSKIFMLPLPTKAQNSMAGKGIYMPNILKVKSKNSDSKTTITAEEFLDSVDPKQLQQQLPGSDEEVSDPELSDSTDSSADAEDSDGTKPTKGSSGSHTTFITPLHIFKYIEQLFEHESELISMMYNGVNNGSKTADPKMFFMETVPVIPSRFRPPGFANNMPLENPQTAALSKVITLSQQIQMNSINEEKTKSKNYLDSVISQWIDLQLQVNMFVDSSRGNSMSNESSGIKQLIEKKEGLFRMNMMGKRVNYSARSVISPDVNIETSEIGLPPVFALKLTYPEPVTHFNVEELRQAVIRGPYEWPGATHVQQENGAVTSLLKLSTESRIALANQLLTPQESSSTSSKAGGTFQSRTSGVNKKVFRHVKNGDVLLVNRQPTLHKPSIMAHRARILPGEKTIRMHYANCNTYNADFDGDEINLHLPQNEIARAEAMLIANTDSQYLVPTNGGPLRGLIQDHIVTAVHMCSKDTFFTRELYHQILYGSLRPEEDDFPGTHILTLPPAIMKPKKLWTGKQVISTIIKNLTQGYHPPNLKSKTKISPAYWGRTAPEESHVIVMDGELLTGVLDKSQIGASAYGLVHSIYELYTPKMAGTLLSILSRLLTKYVQFRGFTCRMDDLRLTLEGDQWRRELLTSATSAGQEATVNYVGLEGREKTADFQSDFLKRMEEVYRNDDKLKGLDGAMKGKMNGITSSVINKCIPRGLYREFPDNHMQMMTVSGAKGSNVNVSQISCLLGQQELEGRRVPIMVSGKSLPSFQPFETSARAGGFIAGRFLTGIKPQEYFFHCMAGREGLIDTAVKTARSGYLQRCLIKHLEGLKVHYDYTVRDSDGSILQFIYGEDGLDVTKQKHLDQFEFCAENYSTLIHKHHPGDAAAVLDQDQAISYNKKALKKPNKYDTALSIYSPARFFGSVSEKFAREVEDFSEEDPKSLFEAKSKDKSALHDNQKHVARPELNKRKFKALMNLKYLHSLAAPGEAVGLLAAQGVGEPSTQMTLNTFHFAGFGAKNVTLGIPRLREIVMTASADIATPSMTLLVKPEVSQAKIDKFCRQTTRLTLAEVMDDIEVTEKLVLTDGSAFKEYRIRLNFFPESEYHSEYRIKSRHIQKSIERHFIKRLEHSINADIRKLVNQEFGSARTKKDSGADEDDESPAQAKSSSKARLVDEDEDENDALSDQEDDATGDKITAKRTEMASYSDEEDEAEGSDEEESDNQPANTNSMEVDDDDSDDEKEDKNRLSLKEIIIETSQFLKDYKFDSKKGAYCELVLRLNANTKKVLMINLVEKTLKQTVIHEVKKIQRCFFTPNEAENDTNVSYATINYNFIF